MPQIHVEGQSQFKKPFNVTFGGIPIVADSSAPTKKIIVHPDHMQIFYRVLDMISVTATVSAEDFKKLKDTQGE